MKNILLKILLFFYGKGVNIMLANFLAMRILMGKLQFKAIPECKIKEDVRAILVEQGHEDLTKEQA